MPALVALRSVGTVLFTALGIGVAVIGLHGSFRVPDDLFLDETEVASKPFLDLASVAAAVAPAAGQTEQA